MTIEIKKPATGEVLYSIEETSQEQIQEIYKRAREASEKIGKLTVAERLKEVDKLRKYLLANHEEIINKVVIETGKTRTDAFTAEIFSVLDFMDFLDSAKKILKDRVVKTPLSLLGKKSIIYYEPLGVALVISPWNYPFHLTLVPSLCAFITGNATIYKPSEVTPLKGLIEEIIQKSGFMENALQIVYGSGETGKRLIDARPDKVLFTGSVATGRKIAMAAAENLIPVELELGGKDPMVVFEDVNLERTTSGALWGAFTNSGQSCTSVERLYVHEKIYDSFVDMLKKKTEELVVNSDDSGDADVGCMTPEFQLSIVEKHVEDAKSKGAKILTGGKRREDNSMFYMPTLLTDVDNSMDILTQETFGPVLPIIKFGSEEEVIQLANDSEFGLSASVWSKDLDRAKRVARAIKTGNVSINNVMLTEGNADLPFGGTKNSGIGRIKGEVGLHAFTNIKSILVDKQSSKMEPNWYPYTRKKYVMFQKLTKALFTRGPLRLLKVLLTGPALESFAQKKRSQHL